MNHLKTIFILLLFSFSTLQADLLSVLKKEAKTFKTQHYHQKNIKNNQSVKILLQASEILIDKKQCLTAYQLLKTTFKLGQIEDNAENWLRLSQAAYCAKRYKEASKTSFIALQQAQSLVEKDSANALLGLALSQRYDWRRDWKPLALTFFEKVLAHKKVPVIQKRYQQLVQKVAFKARLKKQLQVESHFTKKDRQSPALCFSFNKTLPRTSDILYQDYVKIEPQFKPTYKVDGSELCVYGAKFGQAYQVNIRQGLGNQKYKTPKDFYFELATTHRDPALWFKNNHYLLAKNSHKGIPLYSINSKAVKMTLYRIDERNILNQFVRDYFQKNLSQSVLDEITADQGEQLWQSVIQLPEKSDQQQSNLIQLPQKITQAAGLYVLVAEQQKGKSSRWENKATQWLVISDVGLTSYQGENGLTVIARSLQTNQPLINVPLTLYARNNRPLTQIKTDKRGIAFFDKAFLSGNQGNRAVQVSAIAAQGLSFLNISKAAIDLSDRGIRGRLTTGAMDAFLYAERGVYRPNETAHLIGLLRDHLGLAISDLPLTLRLYNPANKIVIEKVIKSQHNGAYEITLPLSRNARTGRWRVVLLLNAKNNQSLGETNFLVEAIKPPKVSVTLTAKKEIKVNQFDKAHLNAQYLFGAPVIDRPVKAHLTLEKDSQPFADYADFHFDLAEKLIIPKRLELQANKTNKKGLAAIKLNIPPQKDIKQPLKARLHASVIDTDGQTISTKMSFKVRHLDQYLGIKPSFKNKKSPANEAISFALLHLNAAGEPTQKNALNWTLFEEKINYQWFYKSSRWQYERSVLQIVEQKGQVITNSEGLATIQATLAAGHYRLVLTDPKNNQSSSFKFTAGHQLDSQDDTPDALALTIDKASYQVGETAKIAIQAPFAGDATLVIASDRIHHIEHFKMTKNHQIEVPIKQNWGAGAYALITAYQNKSTENTLIKRAIGVIWLKQDQSQKTLKISMKLPDEVRPRQTIQIPLSIQQAQKNETVYFTLAAVDEGVLSLTNYQTPDPLKYFFGQRQLSVKIHDHYGQLIQDPNAKPLALRQGAGSARRGMPNTNIKITSLFSGILTVDDQGQAQIPVKLPDYNGRLRLMLIAWTKSSLGAVSAPLLVRDPLIVSTNLPRFLAVNDKSQLNILMINPAAPEGEYQATLSSATGIKIDQTLQKINLKRQQQGQLHFKFQSGDKIGQQRLHLTIKGPEDYFYQKILKISVRGHILPTIESQYQMLQSGEKIILNSLLLKDFYPGTAKLTATFTAKPSLDVKGLLDKLDRYPHGCLEQTTSRAFPLLYVNELSKRWQYKIDPALRSRIQNAIVHILQKQRYDGAFGLWSEKDVAEEWLTSYTLDFLLNAQQNGYDIPPYFLNQGLNWLKRRVQKIQSASNQDLATLAYAHYVLTKAGKAETEETRYLFDTKFEKIPTVLAKVQLGVTLTLQGDHIRAKKVFDSLNQLDKNSALSRSEHFYHDYGSHIRDTAAIIYLLEQVSTPYLNPAKLFRHLNIAVKNKTYLSTQEQAWMVLAALSIKNNKIMDLMIDDKPLLNQTKPVIISSNLKNKKVILNKGKNPIWLTLNKQGSPKKITENKDQGFHIQRQWLDKKGQPVDLKNIHQGDLIFSLITVKATSGLKHRAILMDLIPAGMAIENNRLENSQQLNEFRWLPKLSPTRYNESLDDRFVAAFDIHPYNYKRLNKQQTATYHFAYMMRAVTQGEYNRPAAEIEDMYLPEYRARTDLDKIIIKPLL